MHVWFENFLKRYRARVKFSLIEAVSGNAKRAISVQLCIVFLCGQQRGPTVRAPRSFRAAILRTV